MSNTKCISLVAVLLVTACLAPWTAAKPLTGDTIATSQGPLTIHPLVHATFVMAWHGKILYFDPVGGSPVFDSMPDPDVIFITHAHGDHLSVPTLKLVVKPDTKLIVPQSVFDKLPAELQARARVMANGADLDIDGFSIRAVAMYNLPENGPIHHPKGWGNGYVLTLGGKRIYVSGDTDGTPEMRALKNIDVAFVCMNPPYTMPVEQAADAVLAFKPKIVYPYHYRSPTGLNDVGKFKRLVESADKSIDVRLRDWYPNR
ncbi:MAG TPA: MBL fold metallo-hydrolase [Pseudomonadales bacterium]|nr:MBL fold metallo-hydrolase [Pseudomonadales bacterium]